MNIDLNRTKTFKEDETKKTGKPNVGITSKYKEKMAMQHAIKNYNSGVIVTTPEEELVEEQVAATFNVEDYNDAFENNPFEEALGQMIANGEMSPVVNGDDEIPFTMQEVLEDALKNEECNINLDESVDNTSGIVNSIVDDEGFEFNFDAIFADVDSDNTIDDALSNYSVAVRRPISSMDSLERTQRDEAKKQPHSRLGQLMNSPEMNYRQFIVVKKPNGKLGVLRTNYEETGVDFFSMRTRIYHITKGGQKISTFLVDDKRKVIIILPIIDGYVMGDDGYVPDLLTNEHYISSIKYDCLLNRPTFDMNLGKKDYKSLLLNMGKKQDDSDVDPEKVLSDYNKLSDAGKARYGHLYGIEEEIDDYMEEDEVEYADEYQEVEETTGFNLADVLSVFE